ncbi:hypothetical protein ANN_14240 [Periplaneta americana]|uniref:Reverse transcriptase n=1 Tax=Periplaneta americana TaxID=6978 RepID=A0ABQ8SX45_PERAM|nr:hypothetical protein ANN_14240 [Periplaneta americana]
MILLIIPIVEEVPAAANSWIIKHEGLSSSEWREMLKMIAMVASVRYLPGRSTGTTHCRHCSEYETLPHVLGSCLQGEVLRIKRQIIRSMIADALRSKDLDFREEVNRIADGGSNRRIDIIAINRNKQTAEIIDNIIRFQISATQSSEVNEEKKKIYEPTIQYLSANFNIEKITVTGLFFGARGTISKAFIKWREKYKLTRDLQDAIVTTIIKFSNSVYMTPQDVAYRIFAIDVRLSYTQKFKDVCLDILIDNDDDDDDDGDDDDYDDDDDGGGGGGGGGCVKMKQYINIVVDIKLRRLQWLGHVARMENNLTPKALLDALPVGRRKVGRPKLRRLDDVQADLTKVGIRRWRTRALDRSDWSDVLREAKAKLQGP